MFSFPFLVLSVETGFCRCPHTSCSITTFSESCSHDSPTVFSQFTLINPAEVFLPLRNFSWQSFSVVNHSFLLVLFLVHIFTIACVTLHCIYLFRCLPLLPGNESMGQEWTSLPSWFQYLASFCYAHTLNNICLLRDFPVGLVAMTLCSSLWRGPGFEPWSGNYIPHATTKDTACDSKDQRSPWPN